MVLPIINANESMGDFLDIAIQFGYRLGEGTLKALKFAKNRMDESSKPLSLNEINNHIVRTMESELSKNEFEIMKGHLPIIFDSILPLFHIQQQSTNEAGFPAYGNALQQIVKKVHNALYQWKCFDGFYLEETNISKPIGKKTVTMKDISGSAEISRGGKDDSKEVLKIIELINAFNVTEKLLSVCSTDDLSLSRYAQVYFGLGEANRFLYVYDRKGDKEKSWKVLFSGHRISLLPIHLWGDKTKALTLGDNIEGKKRPDALKANVDDFKTEITHYITSEDFLKLSKALISDLLYYSMKIREKSVRVAPQIAQEPTSKSVSFGESIGYWRMFFQRSAIDFVRLEDQANWLHSFYGVMIATSMIAFSFPLSLVINPSNWLVNQLAGGQIENPVTYILVVLLILICLFALLPSSFYLMNGLVFISAGFFGGQGKYLSLSYLTSLLVVPLSVIQLIGFLFLPIGTVGFLLGILIHLVAFIYGCLIYSQIIHVVFKLEPQKAWMAMLIPFTIAGVFILSVMMLGGLVIP